MSSSLSALLHQFLDIYQREPDKLHRNFSESDYPLTDAVPPIEQREILTAADERVRTSVFAKTLIDTRGPTLRHRRIEQEIGDSRISSSRLTQAELLERLWSTQDRKRAAAEQCGLNAEAYDLEEAKKSLARNTNTATEFLRYIADNLDEITSAVESLDATEFSLLIPDGLIEPFRELHINAVLGNFGTTSILCGTLLERALKDLLPSESGLGPLITEAKEDGLLTHKYWDYAKRIKDDRNDAVHGNVAFNAILPDHAWETVKWTRELVSYLYRGRL